MATNTDPFVDTVSRAKKEYSFRVGDSDYNMPINEFFSRQKKTSDQRFRDQVVSFRKVLFYFLLVFMTIETLALFLIIGFASFQTLEITPTTLQILVGATIAQISAMLIVIIRSVYSDTLNQLIMSSQPESKGAD